MANDINIGQIAEQLSHKADTDMNNVMTTMSSISKSYFAGLSMPSNSHVDLALDASGSKYSAPANGWFARYIKLKAETSTSASYVGLYNVTKFPIGQVSAGVQAGTSWKRLFVPVLKGDEVQVNYANITTETPTFRFIYAEGEV